MSDANIRFQEKVAKQLIKQLKKGTAPWVKPWNADSFVSPANPLTEKRYRGANKIILMSETIDKGYEDPRWLTEKQAKSLDAGIKDGEKWKATQIVYWKYSYQKPVLENGKPVLDEDGKKKTETIKLARPRHFFAFVYNAKQLTNMPEFEMPAREFKPIERAEKILSASGANIIEDFGDRAYYSPAKDKIHMPQKQMFSTEADYYSTTLHELGHWTGHESRLDRDLKHPFGSKGYAKEELNAEIASMMLGGEIGLEYDPSNHHSYIDSWIKILSEDHSEIFRAAAAAEKIHEYMMELERQYEILQAQKETVIIDVAGRPLATEGQSITIAGANSQASNLEEDKIIATPEARAQLIQEIWEKADKRFRSEPSDKDHPFISRKILGHRDSFSQILNRLDEKELLKALDKTLEFGKLSETNKLKAIAPSLAKEREEKIKFVWDKSSALDRSKEEDEGHPFVKIYEPSRSTETIYLEKLSEDELDQAVTGVKQRFKNTALSYMQNIWNLTRPESRSSEIDDDHPAVVLLTKAGNTMTPLSTLVDMENCDKLGHIIALKNSVEYDAELRKDEEKSFAAKILWKNTPFDLRSPKFDSEAWIYDPTRPKPKEGEKLYFREATAEEIESLLVAVGERKRSFFEALSGLKIPPAAKTEQFIDRGEAHTVASAFLPADFGDQQLHLNSYAMTGEYLIETTTTVVSVSKDLNHAKELFSAIVDAPVSELKMYLDDLGIDLQKDSRLSPQAIGQIQASVRQKASEPEQEEQRVYLEVPYREKGEIKALGGSYDPDSKKWYVDANAARFDPAKVEKWLPGNRSKANAADHSNKGPASSLSGGDESLPRTYFYVPYRQKDEARSLGASYDPSEKLWFVAGSDDVLKKFDKWLDPKIVTALEISTDSAIDAPAVSQSSKEIQSKRVFNRTYLYVPAQDKADAKNAGAKFDFAKGSFYTDGDPKVFSNWTAEKDRIYLDVHFKERFKAKALGASWDDNEKKWFVIDGTNMESFKQWIPEKQKNRSDSAADLDPAVEFKEKCQAMGLIITGEPKMNGRIQRVPVEGGKKGSKDGAYVGYSDGVPAGFIENHKTGERDNWKASGYTFDDKDKLATVTRSIKIREEKENERMDDYEKIAQNVKGMKYAAARSDHGYLKRKNIEPNGIAVDPFKRLLIPAVDVDGKVWSAVKIDSNGDKRNISGGMLKGNFYPLLSDNEDAWNEDDIKKRLATYKNPKKAIILTEGFSTAAIIKKATGLETIATFQSGNLVAVAEKIRERFPKNEIFIFGDDDHLLEKEKNKNPGKRKAIEAATKVAGHCQFPIFPAGSSKEATDYCDLEKIGGLDAVRSQVLSFISAQLVQTNGQDNIQPINEKVNQNERNKVSRNVQKTAEKNHGIGR